jgi:hypothetical protein
MESDLENKAALKKAAFLAATVNTAPERIINSSLHLLSKRGMRYRS